MVLFEEIKREIIRLGKAKSAYILARASASACNTDYGVSLLQISVGLDRRNKLLAARLFNIRNEPDYSNHSQHMMLDWLENNDWCMFRPIPITHFGSIRSLISV